MDHRIRGSGLMLDSQGRLWADPMKISFFTATARIDVHDKEYFSRRSANPDAGVFSMTLRQTLVLWTPSSQVPELICWRVRIFKPCMEIFYPGIAIFHRLEESLESHSAVSREKAACRLSREPHGRPPSNERQHSIIRLLAFIRHPPLW